MLQPLQQFICDKCKKVIERPEFGYVEYLSQIEKRDGRMMQIRSGFKIVHNSKEKSCHFFERSIELCTLPLRDFFVNDSKFSLIFSFLDEGEILTPTGIAVEIKDVREYTDFVKRILIPYYEEARIYFDEAKIDGFFDGDNEYFVYSSSKMKEIVEKYTG